MDVLRRSARKSRMERIKNEYIKEIMGVKGKPDIIDIIEQKRLQWYGHVKRMPEGRIPKLIMDWIPRERRKRGSPRKTWIEGVQAGMTTRNLESDQWRNREEWRLVSGRRRQLLKDRTDLFIYLYLWFKVYSCLFNQTIIIFSQEKRKQPSLPSRNNNLCFYQLTTLHTPPHSLSSVTRLLATVTQFQIPLSAANRFSRLKLSVCNPSYLPSMVS